MKKIIFICLIFALTLSCSSDDDINLNAPKSIAETTWEAIINENVEGVFVTVTATLEFAEVNGTTFLIGSASNGNDINEFFDFTYTYSNGAGTLSVDGDDTVDNFTVNGNILNISGGASGYGISLSGEDLDFIKQ
jgi:hypothetical protein